MVLLESLDISDRMILRMIKAIKLFIGPITNLMMAPDGVVLAVSSKAEKGIYFLNSLTQNEFAVIGYLPCNAKVISIAWLQLDSSSPAKLLAIMKNSLLMMVSAPNSTTRKLIMDNSTCCYSMIDNHMNHILCNQSGDILITGEDRKLKKYDVPESKLSEIDFRKPAQSPAAEYPRHGLPVVSMCASSDGKLLVTGAKDGTYYISMMTSVGQIREGKSHGVYQGGISSVTFSPARNMLYVGGADGSFIMLNMSKEPLPVAPKTPADIGELVKGMDEIEDKSYLEEKIMLEKWKDEDNAKKEEEKEKLKAELKTELHTIKDNIKDLLAKNEEVPEIERLGREEFLIDRGRKERMLVEKDEECVVLRKKAKKENLRNDILRLRIKERTWDTMEIQSTGCKSLNTEQMIFNYPIRKQSKMEQDLYNKTANMRRLEIKDQIERTAEETPFDKTDISKECEHYIVNRFANQPLIQEELQEKILPSMGMQKAIPFAGVSSKASSSMGGGPEKEKITYKYRRPGLLARGGKRAAADVDDKTGKERKEEQKLDDIRLTIKQEKKELEYFRKNWKIIEGYELLYEPFELQTDARKRMQIIFVKEIIRRQKKEFNKEFEDLCNNKAEQVSYIKEKNQKIEELLKDLKEQFTKFEPKTDIREQPDHILKVSESDITIPKYFTKEEREKIEEERKKEEKRLKDLQSDTIGRRGMYAMIGAVLEVKRELDELEKTLVKQPWMDLPENQLNEIQRQELNKFKQAEEELKERKLNQQKAWKQELNKARNDIEEICTKFEEKMAKLMKKKLFMQLRIYEQELYIIRLSLSLHEAQLLRETKE